jgi:membrane-associated phospholipid phosphatase
MKYLTQLLKEKSVRYLLIPFLLVLLFFIIFYDKGESHLMVNAWNCEMGDVFFTYITNMGDGIVYAILIFILLFIRFKWAFYLLTSSILTMLIVFISKQHLFKGIPRPFKYFEGTDSLHLVDGVKMHSMNSFPSGHTITAFAIFMILVLIVKKEYLKILFVLIAILAGFSRVYLSQHFMIDVFFGAVFGIFIAVFSCSLVDNLSIFKRSWVDKNLLQIFQSKNEQQA